MSAGISSVSSLIALGELVEFVVALRVDLVGAGREEHLRLEDEAVADHPDVGTVAEDLAQPPEEVGAVARQLLDALGERHVQPPAEVGDLGLALLVALLGGVEGDLRARRSGGAAPRSAG